MPITQRLVRVETKKLDVDKLNPADALDRIAINTMVGLLTQLGKVSLYASEVMENLYREAARVGDRSARLRSRVDAFEQELPSIEGKLASSTIKKMSQQPIAKFAAREQREANFFVASTMSVAIHGARAEAKPVPPLGNLDPFSGDSGSCLEKYTDPKFFMKEWVRIEAVKMEEAAAERKARKKARGKNKKGKKAGPRRAKVQAATLNKKIYSDRGAEFAPAQRQETKKIKNTQTSIDRSVSRSGTATDDSDPIYSGMAMERPSMDGGQSGPPAAPPPPPLMDVAPMAPPPPGGGFAAPPPPPIPPMAGAPPAPPVPFAPPIPAAPGIPAAYSAPPAPPLSGFGAPPAPPVPVAPQLAGPPAAPPLAGAPAAPPVPAGFGAVRAPSAAGSLLSQIQAGKSLRKTQEAPPRQATARGGLMDAIKSRQFNLKKVQVEEKKPEATAGGGMAEIMQILARRQAIAESDDDDESDEDDEEWED